MITILYASIVFLLFSHLRIGSTIDCLDENGRPIDWSILSKLPKKHLKEQSTNATSGLAYEYLTPESSKKGWTLSDHAIGDPESIPGRILSPLYNDDDLNSSSTMHLYYNDEVPNGKSSFTSGHTKGAIAFDKDKGIWLVHSVPHYPPKIEKGSQYGYPHAGMLYGQSFLCISLPTKDSVNAVLKQLLYNTPNIYSHHIPSWFETEFPKIHDVINGDKEKESTFHKTILRSKDGTSFTSFAKNGMFHKDLYADFVAPEMKADLLVESWPNGRGRLDSSCKGKFHVENVLELDFPIDNSEEYDFKRTRDHSKWAISKDEKNEEGSEVAAQKKIVCIGDINRMKSQSKRGGGTVCFEHSDAWNAFNGLVKEIDSCSKE